MNAVTCAMIGLASQTLVLRLENACCLSWQN